MVNAISKIGKSQPITAHNAISATAQSTEIDATGFNACLVHTVITGTGTWNVSLQTSPTSGGTFIDTYDNNDTKIETGSITASRTKLFVGLTDYVKFTATEVADGATCTVKVVLINV